MFTILKVHLNLFTIHLANRPIFTANICARLPFPSPFLGTIGGFTSANCARHFKACTRCSYLFNKDPSHINHSVLLFSGYVSLKEKEEAIVVSSNTNQAVDQELSEAGQLHEQKSKLKDAMQKECIYPFNTVENSIGSDEAYNKFPPIGNMYDN